MPNRVVAGPRPGVGPRPPGESPPVPAYAARLAPERSGKAIATAPAGMTVGLSLGIPAGTALGGLIGWRWTFGLLTGLALALAAAALWRLPQLAGERARRGGGLSATIRTPGIAAINTASIATVLGFYVLYTYIAPFVERAELDVSTGTVLFVFGLFAQSTAAVLFGGVVLTGAGALPWTACALLAASVLTVAFARRNGFPPAG